MALSMGEKRKNVLKWLVEFKYKDLHWEINAYGHRVTKDVFGKEIRLKPLENVIRMERACRYSDGVKHWNLIQSFPITKTYMAEAKKALKNV